MATLSADQGKLLKTLIRRWNSAQTKYAALSKQHRHERQQRVVNEHTMMVVTYQMGAEKGAMDQIDGIAQQMGIMGELRAGTARKVQQDTKPHADC